MADKAEVFRIGGSPSFSTGARPDDGLIAVPNAARTGWLIIAGSGEKRVGVTLSQEDAETLANMFLDVVYEVQTVVIDQDGEEWDEVMSESIETAREDAATWRASDAPEDGEKIVIRTRRKAGPWTIVPDEEAPRDEF